MNYLKKYLIRYWKLFGMAILFLTFGTMCDLILPTIMSKVVDVGVKSRNIQYIYQMGELMLIIVALGSIFAITRNILSSRVAQRYGADLRIDLFEKIQTISYDNFNNFETSSLIIRLTNDVTQVQSCVNSLMRLGIKAPLICIGSVVLAAIINPQMALVLVAIIPIICILLYANMRIGYPFFYKVQKALDKVNGVVREYLSGVRVVKAFNSFDYEIERFEEINKNYTSLSITVNRVFAIFSPSISIIVNIGIVTVLWFGGYKVSIGGMKVGQVIAFTNYMGQMLFSLVAIGNVFNTFVRAKASAERIGEIINIKSKMVLKRNPLKFHEERGRIDFQHVYFSYEGSEDKPILKDISFTCMPGETIGIIGSTGSGKSSLVNLIPRFFDSNQGKIIIDGINVKDADPKELRDRIAVVPQKTTLFTGSILDNLRWGKDESTMEEIIQVSKIAQAYDFIFACPEGYNTKLGQGGVNLSGGQKQRISIARALLKKPEILILDDCTSAVDMATESKIREGLNKFLTGLTCLIIAQRITSIMDADKIIVLDNGKIAASGTHYELIQNCGIYQDIYNSQIGKGVA